jgi:hypothetical protein
MYAGNPHLRFSLTYRQSEKRKREAKCETDEDKTKKTPHSNYFPSATTRDILFRQNNHDISLGKNYGTCIVHRSMHHVPEILI